MCDHCGWIIGFSATLGLFFCQSFHEQSFPIGFYDTYVNHGSPLLMIVFLIIIPNTLGRIIPELIINHRGELNTAKNCMFCSEGRLVGRQPTIFVRMCWDSSWTFTLNKSGVALCVNHLGNHEFWRFCPPRLQLPVSNRAPTWAPPINWIEMASLSKNRSL